MADQSNHSHQRAPPATPQAPQPMAFVTNSDARKLMSFGVTQIVLGALCLTAAACFLKTEDRFHRTDLAPFAQAKWDYINQSRPEIQVCCGDSTLFLVAGILGIVASRRRNRCLLICLAVTTVFALVAASVIATFSVRLLTSELKRDKQLLQQAMPKYPHQRHYRQAPPEFPVAALPPVPGSWPVDTTMPKTTTPDSRMTFHHDYHKWNQARMLYMSGLFLCACIIALSVVEIPFLSLSLFVTCVSLMPSCRGRCPRCWAWCFDKTREPPPIAEPVLVTNGDLEPLLNTNGYIQEV